VTVSLFVTLGMAVCARQMVAYTLRLPLLAIGLEIAWLRLRPDRRRGPGRPRTPESTSRHELFDRFQAMI